MSSNLRVIEPFRSPDGVRAAVFKASLGGPGCVTIEAEVPGGDEAEVTLNVREAHDLMLWLRCALSLPDETVSPQGPIARIHVAAGEITCGIFYAPGLPDGKHNVYCEPEAVAPYMRDETRGDERTLRRLLAFAYSGSGQMYTDDGELQDCSTRPFIDYVRDPVPELERKIQERGLAKLRAAEKTNEPLTHRGEVMNPPASAAEGAEARNLNTPQRHGLGPSPRDAEARPADASPVPTCQHDVLSQPNTIGIVHEQGRDKFACTVCHRRALLVIRPGDPRKR